MPVRVIHRSQLKAAASQPAAKAVKEAPAPSPPTKRVKAGKSTWQVGEALVLRDIDLNYDPSDHRRWLVHRVKPVWYRIHGYDQTENKLLLESQTKFKFKGHVDATLPRNYVIVITPSFDSNKAEVTHPDNEVLAFVHKDLPQLLMEPS